MSKGLEALERTRLKVGEDYTIEQYKADYEFVKKELQALEIIRKYPFEVASAVAQPTYKDYCGWFASLKDGKPILSQEEYELLREVLL